MGFFRDSDKEEVVSLPSMCIFQTRHFSFFVEFPSQKEKLKIIILKKSAKLIYIFFLFFLSSLLSSLLLSGWLTSYQGPTSCCCGTFCVCSTTSR